LDIILQDSSSSSEIHEAKTAADFYAEVQEDEAKVGEKIAGLEKKQKPIGVKA
jgi:hypothetical protein